MGSQTPLLQKPVLQGVPSGSISSGCITKQEVFKFIRQHRLQESGVVSHIQVCKNELLVPNPMTIVNSTSKQLTVTSKLPKFYRNDFKHGLY